MILITSIAIAVLAGAGAYLLLKHDLIRVVAGIILISQSANLFIMSSGLSRGSAPIYPLPQSGQVADPLVQAMTLTAIVITFGVSALLLSLVYRVYTAHATLDTDTLAEAEEQEEIRAEVAASRDDPEDDAAVFLEEGRAS
jgi:multicomponent Na+:H+ antiporter subunit C